MPCFCQVHVCVQDMPASNNRALSERFLKGSSPNTKPCGISGRLFALVLDCYSFPLFVPQSPHCSSMWTIPAVPTWRLMGQAWSMGLLTRLPPSPSTQRMPQRVRGHVVTSVKCRCSLVLRNKSGLILLLTPKGVLWGTNQISVPPTSVSPLNDILSSPN